MPLNSHKNFLAKKFYCLLITFIALFKSVPLLALNHSAEPLDMKSCEEVMGAAVIEDLHCCFAVNASLMQV